MGVGNRGSKWSSKKSSVFRGQGSGARGQGSGLTLWFLPCLSSREMMDLMWFSWMMFSTSGLSIRTQYSTSRMPAQAHRDRCDPGPPLLQGPAPPPVVSPTGRGLQSVQLADHPVQVGGEEGTVGTVAADQRG